MRVLITGATGFVGGYLAAEIMQHAPETEIWGAGHMPPPGAPPPLLPASVMHVMHGDLTDPAFAAQVIEASQPEHVYHLAGFASGAGTERERIFHVNVTATIDLLDKLALMGHPCRVLLASSGYAYGATVPGRPARETDPLAPHGAYAESKAAMEAAAAEHIPANGSLRVVATRAFNHTGPHQTTAFAIPAFASQIARIERGVEAPVVRVGNLDAHRDFLDVRDVVSAYRLLLDVPQEEPFRPVNVASGISTGMEHLLGRLVSMARIPVSIEIDPTRLRASDIPECTGDPSLLKALTGWSPKVPIDTTLKDTLDWWRTEIKRAEPPGVGVDNRTQ